MAEHAKRYRAFISYSQKDKAYARRLHQALERYRLPMGVEAAGIDAKTRRLGRFFRDDEEMGATSNLGAALKGAIADAENLIVICSTNSAKSNWVNEEIIHFKRTGRADRIFAVIFDRGRKRDVTDYFPPALRFELGQDGDLSARPTEPLAIDLRKEKFARVLVRIVSGLTSTPFDSLWKREQRRARHARMLFGFGSACVTLVLAAIAFVWARQVQITFADGVLAASQQSSLGDDQRVRLSVLASRSSLLAPAPEDATAQLESLLTNGPEGIWSEHKSLKHPLYIISAEFSADGRHIRTIDEAGAVHVWDAEIGRKIAKVVEARSTAYEGVVRSGALSPDGTLMVTVTALEDRIARVWDTVSGRQIAILHGHEGPLSHTAFSPDGTRILTASFDSTARVWNSVNGVQIAALVGHEMGVISAAFSPDGARIVTASADNTAKVWDAVNGEQISALRGHEDDVISAAFSPDGARIVTASDDGNIRVWDALQGQETAVLQRAGSISTTSAAFSPDGTRIVTSLKDGTAIWDLSKGSQIIVLGGHDGALRSAAFSPDGTRIVTVSDHSNFESTVKFWRYNQKRQFTFPFENDSSLSSALSPDGTRVVTAGQDNGARVVDVVSGAEIAVLRGDEYTADSSSFSPNGSRMFTVSGGVVRVWDAASGEIIGTFSDPMEFALESASLSPDGGQIITVASHGGHQVWDVASGREIVELPVYGLPLGASFTSDGTRVVVAGNEGVGVWDTSSWREVFDSQIDWGFPDKLTISSDGTRILTVQGPIARVWEVGTGREIAVLRGHRDSLKSVAFSPDAAWVVTADVNTVRIWNATTWSEIAFVPRRESIDSAAFSPDGNSIIIASYPSVAHMWDAKPLLKPNWRHRAGLPYLAEVACAETGALAGRARYITSADAEAAPILRNDVGRDVCDTPLTWESVARQLRAFFGLQSKTPGGG